MEEVFDYAKSCKFDHVLEALDKMKDTVDRTGGDDENEGFTRQKRMAEILIEYYKDGAKDPKKAYKALSDIENEDKHEPFSETNFLLEYNCGVFAYFSQMSGKALEHFFRILNNSEDAELFLTLKASFNCMQVMLDNHYIEPAKMMIEKLESLLKYIQKIMFIKENYKKVSESEKKSSAEKMSFDDAKLSLKLEYFSISTGSNLTKSAVSPKNPSLVEFESYLMYFKTRVALLD